MILECLATYVLVKASHYILQYASNKNLSLLTVNNWDSLDWLPTAQKIILRIGTLLYIEVRMRKSARIIVI